MSRKKGSGAREYARSATRVAVVQILAAQIDNEASRGAQKAGGQSASGPGLHGGPGGQEHAAAYTGVVETLTDICERFVCELGRMSHAQAELSGRAQSNLDDVLSTLARIKATTTSSLQDLALYERYEEIAFPRKVPQFPATSAKRGRRAAPPDASATAAPPPGADAEETNGRQKLGLHIEEWMPPLPPPHSYVATPLDTVPEPAKPDHVKMNVTRREVESSLIVLKQGLDSSVIQDASENPFLRPPKLVDADGNPIEVDDAADVKPREPLESEYIKDTEETPTNKKEEDLKDRKKARVDRILADSEKVHSMGYALRYQSWLQGGEPGGWRMRFEVPTLASYLTGTLILVVGIIVPMMVMVAKNKKVFARHE